MTASPSGGQINITFHGVGEAPRPLDPGEDAVWLGAEHFEAVLDEVGRRPGVQISFDDGNASDVRVALPALRRRGLRATFFVVAGRIGSEGFLGAQDIRDLVDAGMTIGCHGMGHRAWRKLGDGDLREELMASRRRLQEVVGRPVTQAACPFGAYDRRVLGALRSYGYERVFTSDGGDARTAGWLQPRNTIRKSDRADALKRELFTAEPAWATVARRSKRLVKQWR
jgi:peptidoglycan/xylan/chitin deacetylase (PgdA/CDA1 family)